MATMRNPAKAQTNERAGIQSNALTTTEAGAPPPLLSICIPSYKRARHLEALLNVLISSILVNERYSVEVIAVNNKSPDDTKERLAKINHPRLRVVNRDEHLDTAEENIIRSLPFARGDYVWFLGDDDIVHLNNFEEHYRLLETGNYDILMFNSSLISPSGRLVRQQTMKMNRLVFEAGISQIVEVVGLLFTFAGVSNVIQRRSVLNMQRGLDWLATSKIYSHVAWMVDSHRDSRAVMVNSPLVFYRQNDYSDGHWARVAEKQNVQDLFFWSLGMVRLIAKLIDCKALSFVQAGLIFEQAVDGSRYRLLDDIMFKTYQQIEIFVRTKDRRQRFSQREFEEIYSFVLRCDPTTFDLLEVLRDGHVITSQTSGRIDFADKALPEFESAFMRHYVERQNAGQFFTRYASTIMGYEVYRLPCMLVAVAADDIPHREAVLRMIDPIDEGARVITALTMDELEARIIATLAERSAHAQAAATQLASPPAQTITVSPQHVSVSVETPQLNVLPDMIADTRSKLAGLDARNEELSKALAAVYSSSSWAMTAPIRSIGRLFKPKRA